MALQPYEHCLSREGFDVSTTFNTLNALQVNGLVIEHCNLNFAISNYSRIELLPNIPVLINSDGWMELSVAVPVAAFKESKRYYESNQSVRQPAVWNEMLVFETVQTQEQGEDVRCR